MEKKKKIVFICGMYGGRRDMFLIKKVLKSFDVIYFDYDFGLRESISDYAKKLKTFIKNLKLQKDEKIGIIGVSAGGVIADYYLKFLGKNKVDKFVSICSPLHGTYLAKLGFLFFGKRKGLKELHQKSPLIKKLTKSRLKNIKSKSFWCYFDPLVPGQSAKGENSEHTLFFVHWIVQLWPPLIYKVKKFFEEDG